MMRWSPALRRLDWLVRRPIAHRGLHGGGIVENTPSAFAAAIAGNYAIECDVQITRDGEAMVFHDETLDRLTTKTGRLRDHSAADLKTVAFKATTDRMQTLAELLDQVAGRVPLVIELKSHWDGDEQLAIRALAVLEHCTCPYAIMSFDPDLIAAVRDMSPATVRGIVADRAVDDYYKLLPLARRIELQSMSHLPRTTPDFISYYFRDLPWPPVQRFRQAGGPVITWTARAPDHASPYADQVTFEGYAA